MRVTAKSEIKLTTVWSLRYCRIHAVLEFYVIMLLYNLCFNVKPVSFSRVQVKRTFCGSSCTCYLDQAIGDTVISVCGCVTNHVTDHFWLMSSWWLTSMKFPGIVYYRTSSTFHLEVCTSCRADTNMGLVNMSPKVQYLQISLHPFID